MKHSLLLITGALLALAACNDEEPQKIVHPARNTHDSIAPVPPASQLKDTTDANAARVTEVDKQKSPSPSPKTGLLNNGSVPLNDSTMPAVHDKAADQTIVTTTGTATDVTSSQNHDTVTTQTAQPLATDNSGNNVRDDGSLPTPLDQGSSETDQAITQGIRKGVTDQSTMSVNGQNVKIISQNGVVTLRGPVADARERDVIYAIALAQPSVKSVNNLLEPLQK